MPEPEPEKALGEGSKPGGQGEAGNDTHKPPPAATARTTATERRAKAERPEPHNPEETENTEAEGKAERKNSSTPEAHPTKTDAEGGTREAATEHPEETEEREPEKPKAEKRENKQERERDTADTKNPQQQV